MEIGEEVAVLMGAMTKDPLCQLKDEPENLGWKCRIGESGSPGDLDLPSAERLYSNLKSASAPLPSEPPRREGLWDLTQCTPNAHPFQSHHLIPKKHLPKKDVCLWLAKNAANSQWELTESTNYDTDDARNGLALPFASTTYQWAHAGGDAEKTRICNEMMYRTGKQLHQGSHTYTDYGEEDALHENEKKGYLGAVDDLLNVVSGQTLSHVEVCEQCKKNDTTPRKVRPLRRVVESVHQVSQLMTSIITARKRFVSRRAAGYTPPTGLT